MSSAANTAQAGQYCVKNTFLDFPPQAPKSNFFRMSTCPGSYSNEPTKDSLPSFSADAEGICEIEAPELDDDDACSVRTDGSLTEATGLPSSSTEKWQRMDTADPYWEHAELQGKMAMIPEGNSKYSSNASKFSSNVSYGAGSQRSKAEIVSPSSKELVNLVDRLKETKGPVSETKTPTPDTYAMQQALFGGYSAPEGYAVQQVMTPALFPVTPYSGPMGEFEGKSTVMMRNLPNKYTRALLLEELGRTGFNGTYDFLYVPMDATTQANKGYAFINFVTPGYAKSFQTTYEDCTMPLFNSSKFISVTLASLQGFDANYKHYATARCNKGDPGSRPLFLREQEPTMTWTNRRTNKLMPKRPKEMTNASESQVLDRVLAHVGPGEASDQAGPAEAPRARRTCKFCPECGAGDQSGHKFCSECGHPLPQQ